MRGCGYISIDRSDRKSAFESLKQASETIQKGTSVMIFPEGTRSEDGHIREFKKGGFILAVDAGVPIVPVVLHGTVRILPKGTLRVHSGRVVLEILAPVETSPYSRKTKDTLISHLRKTIMDAYFREQRTEP